MVQRITLLGVPIDPLSQGEAIARMQDMLKGHKQCHVMTPNSEMLVEASRNLAFKGLLNRTDLNLPDSAGLLWAARYTNQRLPERVAGVDVVQALCGQLSATEPVFLLGAGEGVAEKAAVVLQKQNPNLKIAGTYAGSPREEDFPGIIDRINTSGATLLLVAYGAPQQDMWIDAHLKNMPQVKVAMGVGGTFDFIAGIQKRAPTIFRTLQIEWLWRLIREPKRWKRIFTAVVIFPWMVITRS